MFACFDVKSETKVVVSCHSSFVSTYELMFVVVLRVR